MDFQIEKDMPLPGKKAPKYPFEELDVGDSFFVPLEGGRYVQSAASHHGRLNNRKFATRTVEENGVKGVRVWRLE